MLHPIDFEKHLVQGTIYLPVWAAASRFNSEAYDASNLRTSGGSFHNSTGTPRKAIISSTSRKAHGKVGTANNALVKMISSGNR